ncbi:hypothetical protein SCP_0307270 [Sparassis crispa]|uniref:Protein kinase domain-containing protein n=1 Tax=Sparassis crispa TaxID=139825 RepID=A0A401GFN2_9APHY|nr:hypothetical protein SCP_0307270 [Sparassis crispa]GBE81004.1 hypothetical protein SCP_0307270 [Sparassis crispa]
MSDTSQFKLNIAYDILCSTMDHPHVLIVSVSTGMRWVQVAAEIARRVQLAPTFIVLYKLRTPTPTNELRQGLQIGGVEDIAEKVRSLDEVPHDITQFPPDKVHVVVVVVSPPRKAAEVFPWVNLSQTALVKLLQVVIEIPNKWSRNEVTSNGGVFVDRSCSVLQNIVDKLKAKRTYQANYNSPDFQNARSLSHFSQSFISVVGSPGTVEGDKEFATFYHVLRRFSNDAPLVHSDPSSSLKASSFMVYFIHSPFFSGNIQSDPLQYKEQLSWQFPMFVTRRDSLGHVQKFHPNSDFSVVLREFQCPVILSEVVSQKDENDRYRMLVEAIVAARVGKYLLKPTSRKQFFVIAIYLTAFLEVERYIVSEDSSPQKINIQQETFDLCKPSRAVEFLREMYNLKPLLEELAAELDEEKSADLAKIEMDSSKMHSLNSKAPWTNTHPAEYGLGPVAEDDESMNISDDDIGVFNTRSVHSVLDKVNCEIDSVGYGHPHVALVVRKDDGASAGFLKFVKDGNPEIEILQYLSRIDSPANHTIRPIRVWPIEGGRIVSMSVGGGWITYLEDLDARLWGASQQLFEAVGFMHDHGVAHMDLKPGNIVIPPVYGKLSIIDFSIAERVKGPGHKLMGYVGTRGYAAPEVGRAAYCPIRADLWSCGKVIQELCEDVKPSFARTWLREVSKRLMDNDPDKRPMMAEILEAMSRVVHDRDELEPDGVVETQ